MNNEYDFEDELICQHINGAIFNIMTKSYHDKIGMVKTPFKGSPKKNNNNVLSSFHHFLESEKIEERNRIKEIKQRQQHIWEQTNKQLHEKEKKIQQITQKQKQKVLAECTFKPNIKTKGERRNFNQFIQSQQMHMKKVIAKRESIKKSLDQCKNQQTFKPKINSKKKSSVPVFERLCEKNYKENTNPLPQIEANHTFHPNITQKSKNIRRNQPIDQLLYEDAQRRQVKNKQVESISNSQVLAHKPINYKNQKYAAQKFIKQYYFTLQQLSIKSGKLDYIAFNQILQTLGFVMTDQNTESRASSKERQLVYKAYQFIEEYGVNKRNVCVFLLGLIGIYHVNPINFEEGQQQQQQTYGQLNLQESEGRKLQKQFDLLYRNRLSSEMSRKNEEAAEVYSFQPKINKQNDGLANKHRNHMLNQANQLLDKYPQIEYKLPADGVINHTQLLVLHKLVKDSENKRKKHQQQNKIIQQCTFKPTTLSATQTLNTSKISTDGNLGSKKSIQLYNYNKEIRMKKESLKASRQLHSKDQNQCTFMPKINKKIKEAQPSNIPNVQKEVYRMHKGRQQHQEKKKYFERGELSKHMNKSCGDKIDKVGKESYQSQSLDVPRLIIDINMGDNVQQIYIYKGDQHRLVEIAKKFAEDHGLDKNSEHKLIELLRVEIQNVLEKIDEDEESEQGSD